MDSVSDPGLDKLPPQNLHAEQSVLGSMLISENAVLDVLEILKVDDFYREAHKQIFEGIRRLTSTSEAVDALTVTEELKTMGCLEQVGGQPYIHTLVASVPSAANVAHWARIVSNSSLKRGLVRVGTDIATIGYDETAEPKQAMDESETLMFNLSQAKAPLRFVKLKDAMMETMDFIERAQDSGASVTGTSTGFSELDRILGGFQPSDLVILAARPSLGKTSLALNIAINVALSGSDDSNAVALFSLEMSKKELATRILCSEAQIDGNKLKSGGLVDEDYSRIGRSLDGLSKAPVFIDDSAGTTVMEVRAKARKLAQRHPLKLIVIDYLQLMQGDGKSENRQQEISTISRSLKVLGRELNVPILALSQLSRAVESRESKKPVLSDLRESGAIEQDADVVMFIYRDEVYNEETTDAGKAQIIVAKHRNGPTGTANLVFQSKYARFRNLAPAR